MKSTLIRALKTAGALLLEYYDKPIKTKYKESLSSIVTEADMASDEKIMQIIKEKFPSHNIISEESGFVDKNSEYTWVIDPLDGTSNFASVIPWFGILISVFKGNTPFMGGAYLPLEKSLYFAETAKGVFKNGKALPQIVKRDIKDSLIAFSVDYPEDKPTLEMNLNLYEKVIRKSRNLRATNSLVDFIYLLEGKFGGLINLKTRIWDISAMTVLLSEAGAKLLLINGENISYSISKDIIKHNFPVIAGTDNIIEALKYDNN